MTDQATSKNQLQGAIDRWGRDDAQRLAAMARAAADGYCGVPLASDAGAYDGLSDTEARAVLAQIPDAIPAVVRGEPVADVLSAGEAAAAAQAERAVYHDLQQRYSALERQTEALAREGEDLRERCAELESAIVEEWFGVQRRQAKTIKRLRRRIKVLRTLMVSAGLALPPGKP